MNSPTPAMDLSLPDAVARVAASVVAVVTRRHAGAGVIWRPGFVVTSASALWRAPRAQIVLPGGEAVLGTLRGSDPGTDLAVLESPAPACPRRHPRAGAPRGGQSPTGAARASATSSSPPAVSPKAACTRASAMSAPRAAPGAAGAVAVSTR